MTTGKHIGKVLVQIRPEEDSKVVVPVPRLMQAYPRYYCNPSYSYIIAGIEHSYTLLNKKKINI
jgi:fatty acid synthase